MNGGEFPRCPTGASGQLASLAWPTGFPASLHGGPHRRFQRGDTLFRPGEEAGKIYFLLAGELATFRPLRDGRESLLLRARPGEFFPLPSLAADSFTCYGRALRPGEAVLLPVAGLRAGMAEDPAFAWRLLEAMALSQQQQCAQAERLRLKGAEERILHYLGCEADAEGVLDLDLPLVDWALELGLDHATLYRPLRRLEEEGVLLRQGRRFQLT